MVSGGNERVPLIYNGQGYARGDWPWLVAIYKRKDGSLSFACSGTLVSDRHVVTGEYLSIFYLMTNVYEMHDSLDLPICEPTLNNYANKHTFGFFSGVKLLILLNTRYDK